MASTSTSSAPRARILTGDTPSGKLHIGHWVGSLENRVRLQDAYECYFLIANLHAFTTRADQPREIARDTQGFDGSTVRAATQYDALGRVSHRKKKVGQASLL